MALNFFLLLVPFLLNLSSVTVNGSQVSKSRDLVHSSCVHASYPHICVRTLSSFVGPANTPHDLAKAAVKISITRARKTSRFLGSLRPRNRRERNALSDCMDEMGDSVDELSRTLRELKHLRVGMFRWQMSNAQTWVSASLTDDDTCLDGFIELEGKVRSDVKRRVRNLAKVTSNALYLINLLDESRSKKNLHKP